MAVSLRQKRPGVEDVDVGLMAGEGGVRGDAAVLLFMGAVRNGAAGPGGRLRAVVGMLSTWVNSGLMVDAGISRYQG
jgi:hypothetical protein